MKSTQSKIAVIFLTLTALLAGGAYLYSHRGEESTDDAAISGRTVTISSKLAGYVKTLNINDNQFVKARDVLLEIEPTDYIIRRDKAKAIQIAAQAAALASHNTMQTIQVSAPSNLDAAKAQVDSAKANWDKAVKDLNRMQRLSNEARSQEQLDQAIATEKAAKSTYYENSAKLRSAHTAPRAIAVARAISEQLNAQLKQAEAELAQAENDVVHTRIIAPMDGRITNRGVERGNYIQTGQQLASLVGTELWIIANFKENQLEHICPGQRVSIRIDAFPNTQFDGKVDSIQSGTGAYFSAFPPQNATGNFVKIVQRVPVKIVFNQSPDASWSLGPGMSVVPTVYTGKD